MIISLVGGLAQPSITFMAGERAAWIRGWHFPCRGTGWCV